MDITSSINHDHSLDPIDYMITYGKYIRTVQGFLYKLLIPFAGIDIIFIIYKNYKTEEQFHFDIEIIFKDAETYMNPHESLVNLLDNVTYQYIQHAMGLAPGDKYRSSDYQNLMVYIDVPMAVFTELFNIVQTKHPELFS